MKQLLIVAHAPSPNTLVLRQAVERGARHPEIESVTCRVKSPLDAGPEDVLACDAILLGTPENLGYMSGALKDFFDRSFHALCDHKQGLPCALYVRAGHDGTGTRRGVESIVTGLGWRWVQAPLILRGEWSEAFIDQAEELGLYMAAGLDNGLF
ncbi:NADPH-dependent FMN reductase [Vreelandella songnenensis]|uniref:NADPH-dependent FMN reductase n=1 Tax=Vreelandella songnenensis TaxID=1176243 RepID=A0A2T0UUQ6_9GAMM|nr:NAD(P)H-dependent oxidoreductase [Halomonas songnenensis]PRY61661.1 NADPH-dependent FMN reductase [Halomonas songnenensis]